MNLAEPAAELALPPLVHVEVVGPGEPPAFMSFESFRTLLAAMPAGELRLQGAGDPLLHPRFREMVRHAAGLGWKTVASTPLSMLTAQSAAACVESGLRRVEVDPDPKAAARVSRNLARLLAEKAARQAFYPEVALARRRRRRTAARPEAVGAWIAAARALAEEHGVALVAPEAGPARCEAPRRGLHVGYYGRARPCALVTSLDRIGFGNVLREGVVQVWNSEEYRAFRERLASGDPPEVCRGCAVRLGTL